MKDSNQFTPMNTEILSPSNSTTTSVNQLTFPNEPLNVNYQTEYNNQPKKDWGPLFSHDPAIYYDDMSGFYYTYSTDAGPGSNKTPGGQIRRSKDLIHFEYIGEALADGVPEEVKKHTNAIGVWAPDIIKVGSEYRLYYSCSTFGSRVSAISLAISNSPEGPFTHKGIVIKTTEDSPVNAIDANLVVDEITQEQYLVYGSFWDGIRMLKLDTDTGFACEEGYGMRIASRIQSVDRAIEGPYIRYNEETGYYYLFVSYESLSNHYNVRVGRSKHITGPYLDYHGNEMTDLTLPPYKVGLKITTGYSFKKDTGWIALGHNSVLNQKGDWYMVCHARYEKEHYMHSLNVRKMFFNEEGWPVVSPCLYSGEVLQPITSKDLIGTYARIEFNNEVDQLFNIPIDMMLKEDQTFEFLDQTGTWSIQNYTLTLEYRNQKEQYFVIPSWDYEEWKETIAITGMNQDGICIWGKKL